MKSYSAYVQQNTANLVSRTQSMCAAINAGNLERAKELYPSRPA